MMKILIYDYNSLEWGWMHKTDMGIGSGGREKKKMTAKKSGAILLVGCNKDKRHKPINRYERLR